MSQPPAIDLMRATAAPKSAKHPQLEFYSLLDIMDPQSALGELLENNVVETPLLLRVE